MIQMERSPSQAEPLIAVLVTFNPDPGFAPRLKRIRQQVPHVVVVDNGSGNVWAVQRAIEAMPDGVELIRNDHNKGIAQAFNQGLERAIERGATWAVTLDQDSLPAPDMVHELISAQAALPGADQVAVVAPQVVDAQHGRPSLFLRKRGRWLFRRAPCKNGPLDDVTIVISSGSLINLTLFTALGGFREDFFIDYVDTEYCLRAQANRFRIAVACSAHLEHKLGERREASLAGLHMVPTFHSPARWYYISRNRIPMLRMYSLRFPHWLFYEIVASTYGMLRMLLFEDRRLEKIRAIIRGTFDGLRTRMGPGPYLTQLAPQERPRDST